MTPPLSITSSNYHVTLTGSNRIKIWKLESLSHTKNEVGKLLVEIFEPNHLQIHYTTIAIFDDNANSNNDKNNNCLLALGDSVGRIVLFNISKGCKILEISQRTNDLSKDFKHVEGGHHTQVTCIKFDKIINQENESSIHIITSSRDKKLCRWDINGKLINSFTVGDDNPSQFVLSHPWKKKKKKKNKQDSKYAMIASNTINVWDITNTDNQKIIGSFQGQASKTHHLRLTQDNQYLISAGHGRYVYIWKCNPFYKKNDGKNASNNCQSAQYALTLDNQVVCIDIRTITTSYTKQELDYLETLQKAQNQGKKKKKKVKPLSSSKTVYYICAASKTTAYIWCYDPVKQHKLESEEKGKSKSNEESGGNLKPVVEITICDEISNKHNVDRSAKISWIQHIHFMNNKQLMVIRGNQTMPVMKQVDFIIDDEDKKENGDIEFISNIILENVSASFDVINGNVNIASNALGRLKNSNNSKYMTVLHVADVSIPNPKSYDQYENGRKKRKRRDDGGDDSDDDTDDDKNGSEPAIKRQRIESAGMTFAEKLYEIERKTEQDKNETQSKIPNADSLYTLLTQSLSANDQLMFDRLLGMVHNEAMREFEEDIIKNTLDRISSSMAIELLEKLTDKFRVSPRQSIAILRWLLPLLNSHSASFAKDLSSRKYLISIHQAIDYQIKSLLPAMKLQGRLSLLMNQMEKVNQFTKNNAASSITKGLEMARKKPLFIHDETMETTEEATNEEATNEEATNEEANNDHE